MTFPKMRPVSIWEADTEQRREYAVNFLQIDIEGDTDEAITSKIMQANAGSEQIFVSDVPAVPDQGGDDPLRVDGATHPELTPVHMPGLQGSDGKGDPQVVINIPVEMRNNEAYDRDVEVGVNGRCWQMRRGIDLPVPYRVYLSMRDAVGTSVDHKTVGADVVETERSVPRIPFNVVRMPSDEAIAAWHERTDKLEMA
jgi:hypothetical protein